MVIEVDENCRDCPEVVGGGACERGFWAPQLFAGKASLYDSRDEEGQGLSFEVVAAEGDMTLFAAAFPQPIVNRNGSIFFCLREDQNGEASFRVR